MNQDPIRVLIVEDDHRLAQLLSQLLSREGYQVTLEARGDAAVGRVLVETPELVLLDVGLPGLDGFQVCQKVRAAGYRGVVLILTARGEAQDEVQGLECGADDYIAKPMRPEVLLARVRARLRGVSKPSSQTQALTLGGLRIDRGRREVCVNDRFISLSTAEYDLLVYLADHAGQVRSRDQIYQDLRGIPYDGVDRSIDLRIARLRRLLGEDVHQPQWIKTIRGVGYLMMEQG